MKNSCKKLSLKHFTDDTFAFLKTNDINNEIMAIENDLDSRKQGNNLL